MEIDIEPVYIKNEDINIRGNVIIKLCDVIRSKYPGEVHGAQPVNENWLVYVRSNRTRAALIVSGINVNGVNVQVYDEKPQRHRGRSERVVLKDLPATLPPEKILSFLRGYPQIVPRSRVLYAKERLSGEEISPYINGDRLLYVNADVSPPLPKEAVICGHKCRIWHQSQKNFCKRCATHGHRTSDIGICESYDADSAVVAWRADSNPLSNSYKCRLAYGDCLFKSAEHFYQHELCLFLQRKDIAQQVLDAASSKKAKQVTAQLKAPEHCVRLAEWDTINLSVMAFIMKVKWNQCAKFRQAILSTEGMTICEATSCDYWGVGVAPNLAQYTKPSKFLGKNHMGKLQMALRIHVSQNGILNEKDEMVLPTKPSYTDMDQDCMPAVGGPSPTPVPEPICLDMNVVTVNTYEVPPSPCSSVIHPSESTPHSTETSCTPTPQSNDTSGASLNTPPVRPSRRKSIVRRKPSELSTTSNMNTLDNYITKESSSKRKPSGDAASPSSVQVSKSTRTDGADSVS